MSQNYGGNPSHGPQQPGNPNWQGQQPPAYHGPQPGYAAPGFAGPQAPAPKPKKPLVKRWWFWLLAVIVLFGIIQAASGGSKGSQPSQQGTQAQEASAAPAEATTTAATKPAPAPKKERLTLDEGWEMDKSNPFAVYVKGYVTNNSEKPISNYVQITFDVLDTSGANLGTCLANTNTIDANGKWRFEAVCSGDPETVGSVRFKEITGF